ncbi:MAG: ABC transporter substrate-binding protein [Polaromonas sp.]|nr:MAG: ABC transporter substrate-binding protein [Polaromonas sp.]
MLVGLDGEFGREGATSAQSIELGLRAAILQINAAGGVLGGRAVELVSRDNREILARSVANTAEFSAMPDLVAVFAGRSSPLILAQIQAVHAAKLPYLVPWAAADSIIDNGMQPNYVFRLSLQDSLAMPRLLQSAQRRGFDKVGLLLLNTSFGNSNLAAAEKYMRNVKNQKIVGVDWFNLRDTSLIRQYKKLTDAGAKAVLLSANYEDAAVLVREVAALPPGERVPVISHWGVTSGTFVKQAGVALQDVDFSVIQTFSFFSADKQQLARFMKSAAQISGVQRVEDIEAPLGAAHAYDLMHILARAIQLAGSTERSAIRDALEKVPEHRGLLKLYKPPFTPARHEALGPGELLMARYSREGVLVPAQK